MSGVLNRKVFMGTVPVVAGEKNGKTVLRFADFASVVTTVGNCWEPFLINQRFAHNSAFSDEFDPTDMMRRIDSIASTQDDAKILSESRPLHSFAYCKQV